MTSQEIRKSFLDFFASKQHRIVASAPVIPHGDPTLLFTNAGMNQFKDVFLGQGRREYSRAADTQKCIRVSGKHNDLEEVGVDTYHHTFFEMLGNWSFGDYYKVEAIDWAWELLTIVWKLPVNRLHATVYRTDDEAYEIWKKYLPIEQIHRFDEKDNFWEMGESGPCGPCSEIHFDRTEDLSGGKLVNQGVPEVIEIWNLVFIQFNRRADGTLEELAAKHVDTGMGFERICAVIQGKQSNYDTDVFTPLIEEIEKLSARKYSVDLDSPDGMAMRVIADHVRTLSFAIADGALPGNAGRGYVLRRILRRAARYGRNLGLHEPVLYKLLDCLCNNMGEVFPELISQRNTIEKVIRGEEENFLLSLDRGLDKFEDIRQQLNRDCITEVSGKDAFLLYDTFGFPLDLTELLARENNLTVDSNGFAENMQAQRDRSRAARKVHAQEVSLPVVDAKTVFVGYDEIETEAEILFVSENAVVVDRTPFYTESGGQVSDTGTITLAGEKYVVVDTAKSAEAVIHFCDREVEPLVGSFAKVKIDFERRLDIMRNHSATHLMHQALNQTLGDHIKQAGSLVSPDHLRFDFNHFEKVSAEELMKIEAIVNEKIFENIDVKTRVMETEEARKNGKIKMFFGDKYGDIVRVVTMDEKFSMEFCGGTHVKNTAQIGLFKIISESSIAAGIRRIEAVTGRAVYKYILDQNSFIKEKDSRIEDLSIKVRRLERDLDNLRLDAIKSTMHEWVSAAFLINETRLVVRKIEVQTSDELRSLGESLREVMRTQGIGVLAAIYDEKVQLVCVVTDDLAKTYSAGKIINMVAEPLGGRGGGKPILATAGAKDTTLLSEVLLKIPDIIRGIM